MHYAASSTAICPTCDTPFHGVDRDEDGRPEVPSATRCNQPGCEVFHCQAGCKHLSFQCEGCRKRFCEEHAIVLFGEKFCGTCALDAVEANEPGCRCQQTGADLFDASACEYHNPNSRWNVLRRRISSVQQYEHAMGEVA